MIDRHWHKACIWQEHVLLDVVNMLKSKHEDNLSVYPNTGWKVNIPNITSSVVGLIWKYHSSCWICFYTWPKHEPLVVARDVGTIFVMGFLLHMVSNFSLYRRSLVICYDAFEPMHLGYYLHWSELSLALSIGHLCLIRMQLERVGIIHFGCHQ